MKFEFKLLHLKKSYTFNKNSQLNLRSLQVFLENVLRKINKVYANLTTRSITQDMAKAAESSSIHIIYMSFKHALLYRLNCNPDDWILFLPEDWVHIMLNICLFEFHRFAIHKTIENQKMLNEEKQRKRERLGIPCKYTYFFYYKRRTI